MTPGAGRLAAAWPLVLLATSCAPMREVRSGDRPQSGRSDDLGIARIPSYPRNNAEVFVDGALVHDVTVDW